MRATLDVSAPGYWGVELVEYPGDEFGYGEGPYGGGGYGGYFTVSSWIPDLTTLDALDPRDDLRIRIDVEFSDGATTVERSFNLGLRERNIDYEREVIVLTLASDEALLSDYAPLADDTAPLSLGTSLRDVVDYVLDSAIPGAALESSPSWDEDLTGDADAEAFTWKGGQSGLDFLAPLVQVAGFRLVCNESQEWTLRNEDYEEAGAVSIRHAVNMITADETISRDSGIWYDAAATVWEWTDSLGVQQRMVDAYALTTPYTRLQLFERSTPYPGPGFSQYAVRRAQQRGREMMAVSVSDWNAHAEQSVTIYLNETLTQVGKIQSVSFSLDNDEMTVTARTQDTPEGAIDLMTGIINDLVGTINDQ